MKTIFNKSIIIALVGSFLACTDLEEKPVGLLSPEGLFRKPKDVETAVLGAYGLIASEALWGRQFTTALMLRSDMVDIGDRGTPAERQQVNDFNMDSNNAMVRAFWPRWYQIISTANAAIAGAETLDAPEEELNPVIAEARFVRAFSYYHLVQNFGDLPYIDFFISNPEVVEGISKTPQADVYTKIITDLEFAKQWLPDKQPGDVRSRPTKGTAASFLASTYLTLGDYQQAYDEAKWVIDNKSVFGYRLEDDFQQLFDASQADGLSEPIFTVDFLGLQSGSGSINIDYHGAMTGVRGADRVGWSVCVPAMAVYTSWDDRDYRKWVSMADSAVIKEKLEPYTKFANTKRPHIAKYFRFPGTAQNDNAVSDHNYAAFRYAEVLLIAAEALTEVNEGPNDEAIGYVNEVRARARNWAGEQTNFPEDVLPGLSKEQFIDLVLDERRLELAFEFKRWYDIRRRTLGEAVFKAPGSLEPHNNFDPARDYLMPLPNIELEVNPNLKPQNFGY